MRLRLYPMKYMAIVLLFVIPASGGVKVGEPAPPIRLQALVPPKPLDATLETLKGKVVVLEFWATWCGPCVDAIPHLNELADQFAGKPIQFLSVTDEDPSAVENFLKTRPIHGLVGTDSTKVMLLAYGFEGVPDTVLIDANGKVAGITYPAWLKASDIADLLDGRPLKVSAIPDYSIARTGADVGPAPLLDMIVRKSTSSTIGVATGGTKVQVSGYTIRALLAQVYGMPEDFIIGEPTEDPTRYDISLSVPGAKPATFQQLVPELLNMALHLTTRKEMRDIQGWILKAPNRKPDALKEATTVGGSGKSGNGELTMAGMTVEDLAEFIQEVVHKPVVDKTGIPGRFDLRLTYDKDHPESILEKMRDLGFTVESRAVPTEFMIVSKQ
jgi:uncharacterized protein (TIGR03435 family)